MVTSNGDFLMAVMALKSLLRFVPQVAVVVHGDDTLDEVALSLISQHVPGTRFVSPGDGKNLAAADPVIADYRARFPQRFGLDAQWQAHSRAWAMKVFDIHLSARVDAIVMLDSDSLFVRRPTMLIDWIANPGPVVRYPAPRWPNLKVDDADLQQLFPGITAIPAFNSGLVCFTTRTLTLELMVSVSRALFDHPSVPVFSDECVWRYACSQLEHSAFPKEVYALLGSVMRYRDLTSAGDRVEWAHFLMKHREGLYRRMADQVAEELRADTSGSE
jgi:hypothetical protein